MEEISELLRTTREEMGISINEVSMDLNIDVILLENIENGNAKAFKDVYKLRNYILEYSKYLGLDIDKSNDMFNDYLFEKTSRISLADLKDSTNDNNPKISSPYTKEYVEKKKVWPVILIVIVAVILALIICLIILINNIPKEKNYELKGGYYELS